VELEKHKAESKAGGEEARSLKKKDVTWLPCRPFHLSCVCLLAKALGITDTIQNCGTISFVTMPMAELFKT
jgi:hypothetical protein